MQIRHGEGSIGSLKAVVVHKEMGIISLNRRLLAAHAAAAAATDKKSVAISGDRKPFRMLSDIGEVICRDNWAERHNTTNRRRQSCPAVSGVHQAMCGSRVMDRVLLLEKATREGGSSCNEQSYQAQGELLLMKNHFIEACGLTFSATIVRSLIKVAAFMSQMPLLRCLLIFILAMTAIRKVSMSS
ncbi:unnamed protein product [Urochloa humidicola]